MPEDLKVSQIGSSPLPPPFRGLHSPGVRKHCQIVFACYFRKSSISCMRLFRLELSCIVTVVFQTFMCVGAKESADDSRPGGLNKRAGDD